MSSETPRNNSHLPWWAAMIVAALGLALYSQNSGVSEPMEPDRVATRQESEAADKSAKSRVAGPLEHYLGASQAFDKQPAESESPELLAVRWLSRLIGNAEEDHRKPYRPENLDELLRRHVHKLDFLFVTVADPVRTQNNYRFDFQLDALNKALSREQFMLDGYYLPWDRQGTDAAATEPGVLLYRRAWAPEAKAGGPQPQTIPDTAPSETTGAATDLLMVFLIGEVPTAGIHKAAFHQAIDLADDLQQMFDGQRFTHLRIAGPVFTGSGDSLALAINHAFSARLDAPLQTTVISGSANYVKSARFEELAGPCCSFHSTLVPGAQLKEELIRYAIRNHFEKTSIAWLTEFNTGVGGALLGPTADTSSAQPKGDQSYEMYEFLFPMNIAQVREVYEKQSQAASGQSLLGPGRYRLKIPYGLAESANDMPRMQTPLVTAPAVEIALGQVIGTIQARRIKYVGISASDVRDPIFLAELVHRSCPDAQIMITGSDYLGLHSEYSNFMHGALVASSYSLVPDDQAWCFPYAKFGSQDIHRFRAMSGQAYYGIYNAVVLLRGLQGGMLQLKSNKVSGVSWQAGSPLPMAYGLPLEEGARYHAPPVWISRVSPDGFEPVWIAPSIDKDLGTAHFRREASQLLVIDSSPPEIPHATGIVVPGKPTFNGRLSAWTRFFAMAWLVAGIIHFSSARNQRGEWPRPAGEGPWWRNLALLPQVFHAIITATFVFMLSVWAYLLSVPLILGWYSELWGTARVLHAAHALLCFGVAAALARILSLDVRDIAKASLSSRVWRLRSPLTVAKQTRDTWLSRALNGPGAFLELLILVRRIVLSVVIVFILAGLFVTIAQTIEFVRLRHRLLFWYYCTADIWNGVSLLIGIQLLAVATIVLAYGMVRQVKLVSRWGELLMPYSLESGGAKRRRETWVQLLFPLIKRYEPIGAALYAYRRRHHTLAPPGTAASSAAIADQELNAADRRKWVQLLVVLAVGLLWLVYALSQVPAADFFSSSHLSWLPINAVYMIFLAVCGYWFLRFLKTVIFLNNFLVEVKQLRKLRYDWQTVFSRHSVFHFRLAELLLWPSLPDKQKTIEEFKEAFDAMGRASTMPRDADKTLVLVNNVINLQAADEEPRQKYAVLKIVFYLRHMCYQSSQLLRGLLIAAALVFFAAHSYPYSSEPLMRLTASLILGGIAAVVVWFYVRLDRDPVISGLIGTPPNQVEFNWSLVQTVLPVVGFVTVALLNEAFPDFWYWVRETIESSRRI